MKKRTASTKEVILRLFRLVYLLSGIVSMIYGVILLCSVSSAAVRVSVIRVSRTYWEGPAPNVFKLLW